MADIIQLRRDTAANWSAANPILAQGELGLETDTLRVKVGNGTETWSSLDYWSFGFVLATVATSGSYNDLINKLTAGSGILISSGNVVSVGNLDCGTL